MAKPDLAKTSGISGGGFKKGFIKVDERHKVVTINNYRAAE